MAVEALAPPPPAVDGVAVAAAGPRSALVTWAPVATGLVADCYEVRGEYPALTAVAWLSTQRRARCSPLPLGPCTRFSTLPAFNNACPWVGGWVGGGTGEGYWCAAVNRDLLNVFRCTHCQVRVVEQRDGGQLASPTTLTSPMRSPFSPKACAWAGACTLATHLPTPTLRCAAPPTYSPAVVNVGAGGIERAVCARV